jgi:hypothetical protein
MYVQFSKVNCTAPTGSFFVFCKGKELVKGRNVVEILPEIFETKELCIKARNML